MSNTYLQYSQTDTGTDPKTSVIWMHGLGDHGSSFIPLVKEFDLSSCPPIRFIFPHAPERPISVNAGYPMRAWFDIYNGFDDSDLEDSEGIEESRQLITGLIEQEKRRGVPADRILLAGFSQGCAMALYTGLCYPEKLAGIIGLSGYMPLITSSFPMNRNPANQNTPIFLAHGTHDEVVPFTRGENTMELLTSLDYKVEWNAYHMTHTMSMTEVIDLGNWLRQILA